MPPIMVGLFPLLIFQRLVRHSVAGTTRKTRRSGSDVISSSTARKAHPRTIGLAGSPLGTACRSFGGRVRVHVVARLVSQRAADGVPGTAAIFVRVGACLSFGGSTGDG